MPLLNYENQETKEITEHLIFGEVKDEITIDGVKHVRVYHGSGPSFKFKGSGFYQTDYKDKGL